MGVGFLFFCRVLGGGRSLQNFQLQRNLFEIGFFLNWCWCLFGSRVSSDSSSSSSVSGVSLHLQMNLGVGIYIHSDI